MVEGEECLLPYAQVSYRGTETMRDTNDSVVTVLESISDAFFALDREWCFTYVNHRAELLLQRSREELLGRSVWEEFPGSADTIFYQQYHEAVTTQKMVHFEDYYALYSIWFEVRAYPSQDGLAIYFHDITKRKHAEEERERLLRQIEKERVSAEAHARQVEAILANMTEGIIIADPQGNVLQMNEVAAKIHNYSQMQDFQRNLTAFPGTFALYHSDGRSMPIEEWPLARVLRGEPVMGYEVRVKRLTTGEVRTWSYNGSLVHDELGTVTMAMLTLRDITTHKEAEERVRASEERFRLLCDNAPIGISISQGTSNVYANAALANMFGYDTVAEMLDRPILELVTLESRDQIRAYIAQRERGEAAPISYETTGLRRDGSTFTLAFNVGRMPIGSGVASITFAMDVTERKEAERRKDDFLSMASHELRTPITSVKAYTQLLQRMFEKEGKREPALYLSKMDIQINKLTQLIVTLLDVTRLQADKLVFKQETFDFDALVYEAVENMQQTAPRHSIVMKGSIERCIVGDRERLGQVLRNLIANAIKYSPRYDTVYVSLSSTPEHLTVHVQDYGIGIPKHQQGKVFERFYRVYENNDTTYPGLGIGLYMARESITRHHGTISVESVENHGSIFSFSLPLQKEEQKTKAS